YVRLRRSATELILQVEDNGVGCPEAATEGLGSRVVRLLVQQLRGQMAREAGAPGCRITVTIPRCRRTPKTAPSTPSARRRLPDAHRIALRPAHWATMRNNEGNKNEQGQQAFDVARLRRAGGGRNDRPALCGQRGGRHRARVVDPG